MLIIAVEGYYWVLEEGNLYRTVETEEAPDPECDQWELVLERGKPVPDHLLGVRYLLDIEQ